MSLIGPDKQARVRRNWSGFRTVIEGEDRFAVFEMFDRFAATLNDSDRSSGLDLLTRAGRIVVLRK